MHPTKFKLKIYRKSFLSIYLLTIILYDGTSPLLAETPLLTLPETLSIPNSAALPDFENPNQPLSQKERAEGRLFFSSIRQFYPIVDDTVVQQYIYDLGNLLVNRSVINPNFIFFVVNLPSINAFAGPAGYIGINVGTIQSSDHEGELASVVAHEIAHVQQKHLQRFSQHQGYSSYSSHPLVLVGLLLVGMATNNSAAFAGFLVLQGKKIENILSLLREHEREADQLGLQILTKAGFSGQYSIKFMQRLLNEEYSNEASEFLRTHPLTLKRVSELQDRIKDTNLYAPKSNFSLIQARLSVLTGYGVKTPSSLQKDYMKLFDLIQKGDDQLAQTLWQKLPLKTRNLFLFRLLHINLLLNTNQLERAERNLSATQYLYPSHLEILRLESLLHQKQHKYEQAEKILLTHLSDKTDLYQKHLWALLEKLYFQQKDSVKIIQAKAWVEYLSGLLRKSLELMNNAINLARINGYNQGYINNLINTYNKWHYQLYQSAGLKNPSPHEKNPKHP